MYCPLVMISNDDRLVTTLAGERKSLISINYFIVKEKLIRGTRHRDPSRGYHHAYGGYHEYIEGCSAHRVDTMSTYWGKNFMMHSGSKLTNPFHFYWNPDVLNIPRYVLMISLRCTEYPRCTNDIPQCIYDTLWCTHHISQRTHGIPRCTEHPRHTEHPPMCWTHKYRVILVINISPTKLH